MECIYAIRNVISEIGLWEDLLESDEEWEIVLRSILRESASDMTS